MSDSASRRRWPACGANPTRSSPTSISIRRTQATETFEDERDEGLAEPLREELAAIERAERRLEQGTYGISVESGLPIPDGRLEAIPWAERTTEEQARLEGGSAR